MMPVDFQEAVLGANFTANHSIAGVVGPNHGIVNINHHTPNALPRPILSPVPDFIGRDTDLDAIVSAMTVGNSAAIAGIRGMGGIGKSQLAFAVARRLKEHYPTQVMLGLLGSTATPLAPTAALQRIIRVFRPDASDLPDDLASLKSHYHGCLTEHGQPVLLLADDAANAEQVRPLIPPDGCALLVTSRQSFTLPGMRRIELGTLAPAEAEKLLCDIAPHIGEHAPVLAKLCGYLPLALRVSAELLANDDTRSVPRYLEQLQAERLRHLADPDNPDDPAASVDASLALSYAALPDDAQSVFAQLGVFVGDFTLEAAEAVVETTERANRLSDTLGILRRRSLLDYAAASERYDLHDLTRDFALDRLPDERPTRLRHVRYYAKVVNCQFEHYRNGQNREGMVLFEQERAQTDLAWEWAMRQQQSLSSEFNIMVQNFANAATWAGRSGVLRHPEVKQSIIAHHTRWLATARKIGDRRQEGNALENLGAIYHSMGEVQQAIDYYEQCLQMFRDMGDGVVVARNSWNLGTLYESQGNLMKAVPLMQVYVDWLQQIGHTVAEEHAQILDQVKSKLADQGG